MDPNAVVTSESVKVTLPVRVLNAATPVVLATTAADTNAVVAIFVELSPGGGVGAVGASVNS